MINRDGYSRAELKADDVIGSDPGNDEGREGRQEPLIPTTFVFEVVERANDRLLDRLDALDGFFGVLMTAVLAVILLAIDRFRLVGWYADVLLGWIAILALTGAFCCIFYGWWRGNSAFVRGSRTPDERDAPIPRRFIWAIGTKGEKALLDTMSAIVHSFDANLPIRAFKMRLAVMAFGLLAFGTLAAGAAKVVYLTNGAGKSSFEGAGGVNRVGGGHPCQSIRHARLLHLRTSERRTACEGRR